jgi:DNA-binding LacI/PurR family transcriptional regulator
MLNHERLAVALPGDPANLDSYHGSRFAGFVETAKDYGHPIENKDQHFGAKEAATGITVAKALVAQADLPDAIYVQNLPMALAAFHALISAGVKIPDDISFLGTTFAQLNSPSATDHTTPPLTSVTFHKEEMGRQGVNYLVSAAEGRAKHPIEILLPGVFVAGASTASSALVTSTN